MILLLVPAAFIRGRRLFEGGVYSRAAFIRGNTVRVSRKLVCNISL